MTALTQTFKQFAPLQLPRGPIFRMVAGGALWGMMLSGGLLTLTYYSCNVVCIGDALATTALSVVAGIVTVGPLTVLTARD